MQLVLHGSELTEVNINLLRSHIKLIAELTTIISFKSPITMNPWDQFYSLSKSLNLYYKELNLDDLDQLTKDPNKLFIIVSDLREPYINNYIHSLITNESKLKVITNDNLSEYHKYGSYIPINEIDTLLDWKTELPLGFIGLDGEEYPSLIEAYYGYFSKFDWDKAVISKDPELWYFKTYYLNSDYLTLRWKVLGNYYLRLISTYNLWDKLRISPKTPIAYQSSIDHVHGIVKYKGLYYGYNAIGKIIEKIKIIKGL